MIDVEVVMEDTIETEDTRMIEEIVVVVAVEAVLSIWHGFMVRRKIG